MTYLRAVLLTETETELAVTLISCLVSSIVHLTGLGKFCDLMTIIIRTVSLEPKTQSSSTQVKPTAFCEV